MTLLTTDTARDADWAFARSSGRGWIRRCSRWWSLSCYCWAALDEERLKATLQNRLLFFARFRQRLVKRGIRYAWVEDVTFDLNHHLEWRRLPEAVDQPALEALVGEIASQPLDMSQPLWRCVVVENAGAGSAVVFRVHHCIADGIALLRVFLALADRAPYLDEASAALEERRKQARLAAKTTKAIKPPSSGLERVRWGAAFVTALLRQAGLLPDTRTLLRGPLNGRKRMAWTAPIPLSDIADIRQRLGGRVNDVMLTAVAGAVGRYLRARGERPATIGGAGQFAAVPGRDSVGQ